MAPYLLLGFLVAGILHVLIKKATISKYLGKKDFKSVLYASLLGIPLPLCSCGVIPTGIAFNKEGASKGATVSFLISTPQTGVDSILITYSMLGLPFAILRPIVALISGLIGGTLTNYFDKELKKAEPVFSLNLNSAQTFTPQGITLEKPQVDIENCCDDSSCSTPKKERSKFINIFYYGFVEFMEDIAKWLIIGLVLATFISILIPDDFFSDYLTHPILGILLVLVISIPLYICATGSVPLAAVLLMKGISPGAALVFLMAGPATNIATITVLIKSLGKKSAFMYIISIIVSSVAFGLIIDYTLPHEWFTQMQNHSHNHTEMIPAWLKIGSTTLLTGLLINALLKKYAILWYKEKITNSQVLLNVNGMTCNHCKNSVEKGVSELRGVTSVHVSLQNKTVAIEGNKLSIDEIKKVIIQRGYSIIS